MKTFLLLIVMATAGVLQAQNRAPADSDEPMDCSTLKSMPMTFLTDGSLQGSAIVAREVRKLRTCGLDDYDVSFFGNIEALSTLLKNLTKSKPIDQLTYADLLQGINDMRQSDNYSQLKKLALTSQKLAERVANIRNWEKDVQLFNELGASQAVIDKVYKYLRGFPENELTYEEILIKLK